ncbi:MAG TPA: flippase activity-associated protein Agl23, partial [Ktedonobacteraceae bacterium]|nr:flippase activity-associated protein Agl23 [Ktedonobacteraceae bacterium]
MKSTNKAPRKKANIATSDESGALAHEKERTDEAGSVVVGDDSGDEQQQTAEESQGVAVGTLPELEPEQRDEDDTEAQEHNAVSQRMFRPPTREQLLNWAPFWGVILLGAILRFWGLGDKPLHHDESLHAYFALTLMHTTLENWSGCVQNTIGGCYQYNPLLHGPFQFHMIAIVYKICQLLGVSDNGVNTTTVRLGAATLGTVIVGLPYFLRSYMGRLGAWLACFLLAVSPSMVYFSRFAREDIYMACFTLMTVVGIGCYVRSRRSGWLVFAAAGFSLSYATKEATFLSIAIFGSFLALLCVWELGVRWSVRSHAYQNKAYTRYMPKTAGPLAVVAFLIVLLPLAKLFFDRMKDLSTYVTDPRTADASKAYVQNLKSVTEALFPWLGIVLCLIVAGILFWEIYGPEPKPGRRGLAKYVDPERQPLLDTLVT